MARIHCKGVLTNNCDIPLKYGYIVIERTDEEYSVGLGRTRYHLDDSGSYDFFLKEGYYNIYSMEDRDATGYLLGKAHVLPSDTYITCTIEALITRTAKELEDGTK